MTEIDLSPGRLDVRSQRGQTVSFLLEWPEDLTGRTFTAMCHTTPCTLVVDGTDMTLTIPEAATDAATKRRLTIFEDGDVVITGHWTPTIDGTVSPSGTVTVEAADATTVQVSATALTVVTTDSAILTTEGDLLTRGATQPTRITRAALAEDAAFSERYQRQAIFDIRDFGAVGDGVTDNRAALLAANDAAAPEGGIVFIPRGIFGFTGQIHFGAYVAVQGIGAVDPLDSGPAGPGRQGSTLKCLDADAQLLFGIHAPIAATTGGFTIDGDYVGNVPLKFEIQAGRVYQSILSCNAVVANCVIERTQNCVFTALYLARSQGSNLIIDRGAGGLTFLGCSITQAQEWNIIIQETVGDGPYAVPQHNQFYGCMIERPLLSAPLEMDGCLLVTAGDQLHFNECILSTSNANKSGGVREAAVKITGGVLSLHNCRLAGRTDSDFIGILQEAGPQIHVTGFLALDGFETAWVKNGTNQASTIMGRVIYSTPTPNRWGGSAGVNDRPRMVGNTLLLTDDSGTFPLRVRRTGDVTARFQVNDAGSLQWGPGGSSAVDSALYRAGVAQMRSDNLWFLNALVTVGTAGNGFVEARQQSSDPFPPIAGAARLFSRVVGGKTELCCRFNTGAIQVVATEP
jgi:hypothetical protein